MGQGRLLSALSLNVLAVLPVTRSISELFSTLEEGFAGRQKSQRNIDGDFVIQRLIDLS
jgi:hypothetical protein